MSCYNFPHLPAVFSSPDREDREFVLLSRHLFSSRTRAQILSLLRELAVPEIWWPNPWMSCLSLQAKTPVKREESTEPLDPEMSREPLAALTPGRGCH